MWKTNKTEESEAVELFKELLRFRTVSFEGPYNGEYRRCATFLKETCEKLLPKCSTEIIEFVDNKPVLLVEITGKEPNLPGILLNSHYDVVPPVLSHWETDPFAAEEINGKIYGRGTQDMKCVCIQHIYSVHKLIKANGQLKRTIFLSFVPDEEIGGMGGMGNFVASDKFKEMKPRIGVAFDEGLANTEDKYTVFYGERAPLWLTVYAEGSTGHGSRFIENQAVMKLMDVANKALKRREEERLKLDSNCGCSHGVAKKLGDVMTINLTVLKAGVEINGNYSYNVIPTEALAGFDIRVPVTMPLKEVYAMLDDWTKEEGMRWEISRGADPGDSHYVSEIDESKGKVSIFWKELTKVCQEKGIKIETEIFPAGTDSRFLREAGLDAFGFSPMKNSPILLHEHNEYLERSVFLEGIEVFCEIFNRLADLDN